MLGRSHVDASTLELLQVSHRPCLSRFFFFREFLVKGFPLFRVPHILQRFESGIKSVDSYLRESRTKILLGQLKLSIKILTSCCKSVA